ncbi:hypothetical protein [Bordetella genomosp. 4]|uniref:hypothetical protein n=1 Tax=Bordetella genomosp. 4 TaxID=463044 RepID=UPI000B9EBFA4|nr:hypothetical protein [Bordetella genomosp. 4]OZI45981.1 hypothetical protein CAL21_14775 [Bordetella genomosp. 4]
METQVYSVHDIYPHIRIVMGMVIGLGVTRLLSGVARIVQHPTQYRLYAIHLAWVASVLLMLVHFWWWEFGLYEVSHWTFDKYLFIIGYAIALFLLSALLFPDSMHGYESYRDFFYARRAWFFGLLAATYVFDVVDTLLKGEAHFARFGNEYMIRTPIFVIACLLAIVVKSPRYHAGLVVLTLVYQVWWILRLFDTLG